MANDITPAGYIIGALRVVGWIVWLCWLARTVVRPDAGDHLRWYDRVMRAVGVLIVGSLIFFGIPLWFGWWK